MDDITLSNLIDEGYARKPEQLWPTYGGGFLDRTKFVTSSEVGGCSRKIKFSKVLPRGGFPNWGYAERGHVIEAWGIALIREAVKQTMPGWSVMYAGEGQVSFHDQYQSGTPDGVLVHKKSWTGYTLEVKSVDPRTNYDNLPKIKHLDQVQQNMDLVEANTKIEIIGAKLIHIDASNLQRRKEIAFEPDHARMDFLQEKAAKIMEAEGPESFPPEGTFMPKECDQCDFQAACSALVAKEMHRSNPNLERAMNNAFGTRRQS